MGGKKLAVVGLVEHEGKVLIGKKISKEGHYLSDEWHVPGGKVDAGETPEEAVAREILEEAGIKVNVEKQLDEWDVSVINGEFRVKWFLCKALTQHLKPGDDLADAKFVDKSKIRSHCGEKTASLWPPKVLKYLNS